MKTELKKRKTRTETCVVQSETRNVSVTVHWRDRRTLGLSVCPKNGVNAYAPRYAKREEVERFLQRKKSWILKKLRLVESFHPLPAPQNYVSGEPVVYLGRRYCLQVNRDGRAPTRLTNDELVVSVAASDNTDKVKRELDKWYRIRAAEIFQDKLKECLETAAIHGVPNAKEIKIRRMKRRWGSCSAAGRITLNLELIKTPLECIEYVVMHELCHCVHCNHGRNFYALLARCLPDWRERKEKLDKLFVSHS